MAGDPKMVTVTTLIWQAERERRHSYANILYNLSGYYSQFSSQASSRVTFPGMPERRCDQKTPSDL